MLLCTEDGRVRRFSQGRAAPHDYRTNEGASVQTLTGWPCALTGSDEAGVEWSTAAALPVPWAAQGHRGLWTGPARPGDGPTHLRLLRWVVPAVQSLWRGRGAGARGG